MRLVGISVLFFLVLGCSETVEYDPNDKFLDCYLEVDYTFISRSLEYLVKLDYEGQRLVDGQMTMFWVPPEYDVPQLHRKPVMQTWTSPLSKSLSTEHCLFFENDNTDLLRVLDRKSLRWGHIRKNEYDPDECDVDFGKVCEFSEFSAHQRKVKGVQKRVQEVAEAYEIYWSESEKRKREIQKNSRQI